MRSHMQVDIDSTGDDRRVPHFKHMRHWSLKAIYEPVLSRAMNCFRAASCCPSRTNLVVCLKITIEPEAQSSLFCTFEQVPLMALPVYAFSYLDRPVLFLVVPYLLSGLLFMVFTQISHLQARVALTA